MWLQQLQMLLGLLLLCVSLFQLLLQGLPLLLLLECGLQRLQLFGLLLLQRQQGVSVVVGKARVNVTGLCLQLVDLLLQGEWVAMGLRTTVQELAELLGQPVCRVIVQWGKALAVL